MNAEILPPLADSSTFEPLTLTRPLDQCRVANMTLLEAQLRELTLAGYTHDPEAPGEKLQIQANCFLTREDLEQLKHARRPCVIRDANREIIAWFAEGTVVGETADVNLVRHSIFMKYPWDFLKINELIVNGMDGDVIEGQVSDLARIDGYIDLGEGSVLLPGVYIEGNVKIGRNCKIGPNCYLRGPISIGDNCHVGNAVEIKASMLMNGASVGHLSYVGDSIVGEKANLGAGTITSNFRHDGKNHRALVKGELIDTGRRKFGAIICDNVHTGIHTSIYPGRYLYPNTATLPGAVVSKNIEA